MLHVIQSWPPLFAQSQRAAYVFEQVISLPASLLFAVAGIAFLLKSRAVRAVLCAYVITVMASLVAYLIPLLIPTAANVSMANSVWGGIARTIPVIGQLVFLGIMLLLLLSKPVDELLHVVAEAR